MVIALGTVGTFYDNILHQYTFVKIHFLPTDCITAIFFES